jgi:tRNA G10  N-methylase Trm11
MVRLTGHPAGTFFDPCCGSGTLVAEATRAGWDATGADVDAAAVTMARRNVSGAQLFRSDVRRVPLRDGVCGAVAANLPFGRQFRVDDPRHFYAAALAEIARVVAPGGHVVVLVPRLQPPAALQLRAKFPLQLLGQRTTLWHLQAKRAA